MRVKRAGNLLSGGGGTKGSVKEETKKFWIGGDGVPLDGYGPPIHTHPQYWTALVKFIVRQSKVEVLARWGVVIGVSDNVLLCSFLNCHK